MDLRKIEAEVTGTADLSNTMHLGELISQLQERAKHFGDDCPVLLCAQDEHKVNLTNVAWLAETTGDNVPDRNITIVGNDWS